MRFIFEYAAKFVCGKSDGKIVAPGEYWTAINVHKSLSESHHFPEKIRDRIAG